MLKSKNGGIYRRDSSFVKPFNPPEEVDLPLTVDLPSEGEQVMSEELGEKPLDTVIEHARPKGVTRLPNKSRIMSWKRRNRHCRLVWNTVII